MNLKLVIFILFLIVCHTSQANETANQSEKLTVYTQEWQQCGHHLVRKGIFFKIVDVDWFAQNCQESQDILTVSPVLLRFTYFRKIKRDFFITSATEYFLRNLNKPNHQDNQRIINDFNNAYQDVQDGDIYDLVINAKGSLTLYKNKRLIQSSNNPLIRNNYLKIWFGQDPVLPALKQAFTQK